MSRTPAKRVPHQGLPSIPLELDPHDSDREYSPVADPAVVEAMQNGTWDEITPPFGSSKKKPPKTPEVARITSSKETDSPLSTPKPPPPTALAPSESPPDFPFNPREDLEDEYDFPSERELLGLGWCGAVERAIHRESNRQVAVKLTRLKTLGDDVDHIVPEHDVLEALMKSGVDQEGNELRGMRNVVRVVECRRVGSASCKSHYDCFLLRSLIVSMRRRRHLSGRRRWILVRCHARS